MGDLRIGTASWTDKTLLASDWYPPEIKTPEARLAYYAEQFRLVQVVRPTTRCRLNAIAPAQTNGAQLAALTGL